MRLNARFHTLIWPLRGSGQFHLKYPGLPQLKQLLLRLRASTSIGTPGCHAQLQCQFDGHRKEEGGEVEMQVPLLPGHVVVCGGEGIGGGQTTYASPRDGLSSESIQCKHCSWRDSHRNRRWCQ